MTSKLQRKLDRSTQHVTEAVTAAQDLVDWFASTDPADWDHDVILAQAKILEAAGCHARRTVAAIQADQAEAYSDSDVCGCPAGNAEGITERECFLAGIHQG